MSSAISSITGRLSRNFTGVFSHGRPSAEDLSSIADDNESHGNHYERNRLKTMLSHRFNTAKNDIKKKVKRLVQIRRRNKEKGKRNSTAAKPLKALRNNEGFTRKRKHTSYTAGGVVLSLGWKKFKDTTTRLVENLRDNLKEYSSSQGKNSQSGKIMDPITKETYKEMKHYGFAESLDDAKILLETMTKFEKSLDIQSLGFYLLSKVALQEGQGLVAYGALDVILKAMKRFPTSSRVQEHACLLLWNLATEDANKDILTKKSVPAKIISVMKDFKSNIQVLHMAIGAVKLLASHEGAKQEMVDNGALDVVMNAFFRFCREEPNDADMQETCISCVQNFAHGQQHLPALFDLKAPHMVIRSMLKFRENSVLQASAAACLWNLSIPSFTKDALLDLNAPSLLLSAVFHFQDDSSVILYCFGALRNLVGNNGEFELVPKIRELVHGPSGQKIIGEKINIFDVIYDTLQIHEDTSNLSITKFGEELMVAFDVEDNENTNRTNEEGRSQEVNSDEIQGASNKSKEKEEGRSHNNNNSNNVNSINTEKTETASQKRVQSLDEQDDNDVGFDDFETGDENDLLQSFGIDASKVPKVKVDFDDVESDKKSRYDPENPFVNLKECKDGDGRDEIDELDY